MKPLDFYLTAIVLFTAPIAMGAAYNAAQVLGAV